MGTTNQLLVDDEPKSKVVESCSSTSSGDIKMDLDSIPLPPTPPPPQVLEQTILKQKRLAKMKYSDLRRKILLKRTFELVCEIMDRENGFDFEEDDKLETETIQSEKSREDTRSSETTTCSSSDYIECYENAYSDLDDEDDDSSTTQLTDEPKVIVEASECYAGIVLDSDFTTHIVENDQIHHQTATQENAGSASLQDILSIEKDHAMVEYHHQTETSRQYTTTGGENSEFDFSSDLLKVFTHDDDDFQQRREPPEKCHRKSNDTFETHSSKIIDLESPSSPSPSSASNENATNNHHHLETTEPFKTRINSLEESIVDKIERFETSLMSAIASENDEFLKLSSSCYYYSSNQSKSTPLASKYKRKNENDYQAYQAKRFKCTTVI